MAEEARIGFCRVCHAPSKIDPNNERFLELKKTLPPGFEYIICELETGGGQPFKASFRLKIKLEKQAKAWLKQYQELSRTTWRTKTSHQATGRKMVARLEKGCHHNTRTRGQLQENRRTKNTDCPASLDIRVRRLVTTGTRHRRPYSRSNDPHMSHWPTALTFLHDHNHSLDDPFILSHRDVSEAVKKKFVEMYKDGVPVKMALDKHKQDLAVEHGEKYEQIIADRHYCPDIQFCYRLYYDIFRKDTKSLSKKKVKQLLEDRIEKYNDENGLSICTEKVEDDQVITIVTPLMKRVHSMLPAAGQIVYTNAYVSGPKKPQLYILLADSFVGGLPLACFITTQDSSAAVSVGLEMIHRIVGIQAYFGRGPEGPELFLTTNSEAERSAIQSMYPGTKLVLNIFHVLQSFWQFLFNDDNGIAESDRPYLFQQMKELVYCSSEIEIQMKFEGILVDPVVSRYGNVISHFKDIFGRRAFWTTFHLDLDSLTISGDIGHNFCDAAMKVLKDRPYEKLKSANLFQLLDLVISRVDGKCNTRLLDLAEGKTQKVLNGRYGSIHALCAFKKEEIYEELPNVFTMPITKKGATVKLYIDMNVGFCTCPVGLTGGPCKHQYVLIRYFDLQVWKFEQITDPQAKQWIITMAEGDVLSDIDQLCTRLKEAAQRDRTLFLKPLQTFLVRWSQMDTDERLKDGLEAVNKALAPPPKNRPVEEEEEEPEEGLRNKGTVDEDPENGENGIEEGDTAAQGIDDASPKQAKKRGRKPKEASLDEGDPDWLTDSPAKKAKSRAVVRGAYKKRFRTPLPEKKIQPKVNIFPPGAKVLTPVQLVPMRAGAGAPLQLFTVTQDKTGGPVKVVPVTQASTPGLASGGTINVVPGTPVKSSAESSMQVTTTAQSTPSVKVVSSGQGTLTSRAGATSQRTPASQGRQIIKITPVSRAGTTLPSMSGKTSVRIVPTSQGVTVVQLIPSSLGSNSTLSTTDSLAPITSVSQAEVSSSSLLQQAGSLALPVLSSDADLTVPPTGTAEQPSMEEETLDTGEIQVSTDFDEAGNPVITLVPREPHLHQDTMDQGGLTGLANMADQVEKLSSIPPGAAEEVVTTIGAIQDVPPEASGEEVLASLAALE